jgi:hypothetical protein
MAQLIVCTPRQLPEKLLLRAARRAVELNPQNHPHATLLAHADLAAPLPPQRLALVIGRRWPTTGVRLTVGFLDGPTADLRRRILLHMNAWAKSANVTFTASATDPQVRIARETQPPEVAGYWSYIGTDIQSVPRSQPTMNLEAFTMSVPESEFHRVVRHETGHTLGFPHEHMRRQLVQKIDPDKAIAYYGRTQGWSEAMVRAQVLTPLEDSSLLGTPTADPRSIMCYQVPGEVTRDGKPIIGGKDIDKKDYAFAASVYPKSLSAPRRR